MQHRVVIFTFVGSRLYYGTFDLKDEHIIDFKNMFYNARTENRAARNLS